MSAPEDDSHVPSPHPDLGEVTEPVSTPQHSHAVPAQERQDAQVPAPPEQQTIAPQALPYRGPRVLPARSSPLISAPAQPQATPASYPYFSGQAVSPGYGQLAGGWRAGSVPVAYSPVPYQTMPNLQWPAAPVQYIHQQYVPYQVAAQYRPELAYPGATFAPQSTGVGFEYAQAMEPHVSGSHHHSTAQGAALPSQRDYRPPNPALRQPRGVGPETPTWTAPASSSHPQQHRYVGATAIGAASTTFASTFEQRGPDPKQAPKTPTLPRGPPRKPKQSGSALWVGNLPPRTDILDLKDYFSKDATQDIESVFLISKSNCAFVNYRTEEACRAALTRFHESRFHGARLVCRLRQTQGTSTDDQAKPDASSGMYQVAHATATESSQVTEPESPVEFLQRSVLQDRLESEDRPESDSATDASAGDKDTRTAAGHLGNRTEVSDKKPAHVSIRYFIMKSLTSQDLDASVRDGVWVTQSHNESVLNEAYEAGSTVILIFSANKSGEYYGYAKMASPVGAKEAFIEHPRTTTAPVEVVDEPTSQPTPATFHAPQGRVFHDATRGAIFWEADDPFEAQREEAGDPPRSTVSTTSAAEGTEPDRGKPFQVEWLCTDRLPFYKAKGLRNPWNSNREVKIARDGTELETSVGRALLDRFEPSFEKGSSAGLGLPMQ